MNFEDFKIEEIPYWCRNCGEPAIEVLELPELIHVATNPIYQVCENCYNELCNEELEAIRKRQLRNETNLEWVERCNQVSQKYGFGIEHAFCENCWVPQPHEPDCIECSK